MDAVIPLISTRYAILRRTGDRNTAGMCAERAVVWNSGFTLLEVMLTLCLLVIISTMAWPQLERSFGYQRLRKAADVVRTEFSKARIEAMKTGSVRVFRYEINGNKFRVDMLTTNPMVQATGTTADIQANSSVQPTDTKVDRQQVQNAGTWNPALDSGGFQQKLPKEITFAGSKSGIDGAEFNVNDIPTSDEYLANSVSSIGDWSDPIFFYPDGTSTTVRLLLKNKREQTVMVFLRGLTGLVKISNENTAGVDGGQNP